MADGLQAGADLVEQGGVGRRLGLGGLQILFQRGEGSLWRRRWSGREGRDAGEGKQEEQKARKEHG